MFFLAKCISDHIEDHMSNVSFNLIYLNLNQFESESGLV